jgi:DeoR family transcriptional regulator of aga operon
MPLAPRINPPAMILTAETLQDYYEFREDTGRWQIRLEQAGNIPNLSAPYVLLHECRCKTGPGRIGYVLNFSSHEYYQNMLQTMRSYTRQKGIALEIVDASQDAARERDEVFRSIGAAAARLVNEGDTIILDAGDAVRWLARALRERKGIRVITNSLSVIQELADRPDITLISCGGVLHHEGKSFIGLQAEAAIRALRADRAFIGAAGVSVDFGLSNSNIDEAAVQQAMLKAAREVILLADPSQIGDESLVQIGSLQAVHCLITGPGIAERDRQNLLSRGVQVMVAEEPPPP